MAFAELNEHQMEALATHAVARKTHTRAGLMRMLAELRLEFIEGAEEALHCSQWLGAQTALVQAAYRLEVASARAEEEARRADALVWLAETPDLIASTRARALPQEGASDG
ncbi:hypothetical protein [Boseongicola sp. H5]|uniref:hypothetical protein n=1 Tax=Boseongicola sp. H5 TaxID=2763261 RepID=UPI001D0A2172|nr:hypothetical protein [Boseongicola sp. H5]